MPQITLQKSHVAEVPPKKVRPAKPPKVKKASPEKDPLTLARLVTTAASDVSGLLKADPHLKRMLKDIADCEDVDVERFLEEVDAYVANLVAKYLTNPARKPRVRFPVVKAVTVCDMRTGKARCIVKVRAWGLTVRVCEDLALPK